jgi:hypothetical protein
MKRTIIGLLIACFVINATAQEAKPYRLNVGCEFGIINPIGLDKAIHVNHAFFSSFVLDYERSVSKYGALQIGAQFNSSLVSIDAVLDQNNRLLPAPDSVKYASMNKLSVQIPIRYRIYSDENKFGRFYQFGATLGYSFNHTYNFRNRGDDKTISMNNVNPYQLLINVGVGKRLEKKHLYYIDWSINLLGYFKQSNATKLLPMQISLGMLL